MKNLLLIVLILIGNTALTQYNSPMKKIGEFEMGMSEKEFLKIAESKYNVYRSQQCGMFYNSNKMANTKEHNVVRIRYKIADFNFLISKTNFDKASFTFINNRLIRVDFKRKGAVSAKESSIIMAYLNKTFGKGAAYTTQLKPNKNGRTDYEKYGGFQKIYSHKPKGGKAQQGYLMEFYFSTKKNNKDFIELRFHDIDDARYWDRYISMGQEFKEKEVKAYREFRGAFLGMYLDNFKKSFNDVKLIENFINEDNRLYNYCDVYTCKNENPSVAGININGIYYYFYKNRLIMISCSLDNSITKEQEDTFIETLQTVYGKYSQLNKKDKISPHWIYKSVNFEMHLLFKKEAKSLIFSFESLGDELFDEEEADKKKDLMKDF